MAFASSGGVVGRILKAFEYRDFRILWFGSFTSSIGTWMQSVAENWLVFSLTGSAFYLGLDAFLQQIPILLFSLFGGVIADRVDRRKMLLASQYVQMICAFTLALLVFLKVVHVWEILGLSFLTGFAQAFGGPASQALVPSLVEKKDLPNAIALNSIQFNLARVVGPLLAGATLATLGMVSCFSLNGVSFLVVIAALLALRTRNSANPEQRKFKEELMEGLGYIRQSKPILLLTILAATTTFLAFSFITLLPAVARSVFHGDVGLYSRLMAFSGAGSVLGALFVAWLGRYKKMGAFALAVQGVCGLLLLGFGLSKHLWLSEILLLLMGAGLLIALATMSSLVQLIVPDNLRGRVMSIFMMAFRGGMPLGSLLAGFLASRSGPSVVLAVNGIVLTIVALVFLPRGRHLSEL
jgi:MFS family permease